MTPTRIWTVGSAPKANNLSFQLTEPLFPGDVLVYLDAVNTASAADNVTSISSPNATWRKIGGPPTQQWWVADVHSEVTGTWTVTVTGAALPAGTNRSGVCTIIRGLNSSTAVMKQFSGSSGTGSSPEHLAGRGQVVFASGYSDVSSKTKINILPTTDWQEPVSPFAIYSASRYASQAIRIPNEEPTNHTITCGRSNGTYAATSLVLGNYEPLVTTRRFKYHNGTTWAEAPAKVYLNGDWVEVPPKIHGDPEWTAA